MANNKAAEELQSRPEERVEEEKGKTGLDILLEELKKEHGVELEPVKNTTYKLAKVIDYLKKNYEFRYNLVSLEVEYRMNKNASFNSIQKRDLNNIFADVKLANHSVGKNLLEDLINSDKVSYSFHPFEEYLFSLRKWNPEADPDYIEQFLDQVKLKDENERPVFIESFKKWFTAMVASLVTNGISNQQCLVFVGRQGIFKTTFLNDLVPKHMQMDYLFSSKFNFENKDHYKYLATKMLINLDELATFSRTDEGILKTILTDKRVVMRLPYGAADTKWWRKASFCGNTNNREFLKDETGNRRFLVFEIDDIVINKNFNIDDIYAQALALFKNGFQYWFDYKDISQIEERNTMYHDVSIEQDLIQEYLALPSEQDMNIGINFEYKTPTAINVYLAGKSNRINVNETTKRRIVQVLRKLGFKDAKKRLNGSDSPTRVWAVKMVQSTSVGDEAGPLLQDDSPI
jgi:predicted P-loop ATPase